MFLVQLFSNAPECTNKMFSYIVGAELEGWGCREDSSKGGAQETWHKQMTQQHTHTHTHTAPLYLKKTFLLQKYNNLTAIMQQLFDPLRNAC